MNKKLKIHDGSTLGKTFEVALECLKPKVVAMSDVKCPICQNNLHKINVVVSTCTNDKCKLWGSPIPNLVLEALQQAKQDLERSEKCCSDWGLQALDYKAENIALSGDLKLTREALDKGMEHIIGLNNMIESWYKLLQSDKTTSTKYAILKSAISAYVENKGGNND